MPAGRAWDLPVPEQRASPHARFYDHAGLLRHSRLTSLNIWPSAFATASAPELYSSAAQWLACDLPYRRFAVTLTDADARLGAGMARYSFTVSDFNRLLLAGLPAHCEKLWTIGAYESDTQESIEGTQAFGGISIPCILERLCKHFIRNDDWD